jgi:hypothetical protein
MNHQAIFNLYPNVVTVDDGVGPMDKDGNQVPIVQSDYEAEVARLQLEQDATQYQRDRQAEYPSIDELVVALWEGVVEERMASVTALEGLRQAVKTKYPKD